MLKEDSDGVVLFHFKKGRAFSGLIGVAATYFEDDSDDENRGVPIIVLTDSFAGLSPGVSLLLDEEPMYVGAFDTSQDNTILLEIKGDKGILYKNGVILFQGAFEDPHPHVFPFVVPIDSGSYLKDVVCDYFSLRLEETSEVVQLSCPGSNGSIEVTITGGFPPYDYLWSNSATSSTISGLDAGTYTLTVTDDSNDEFVLEYEISFPAIRDTIENFVVKPILLLHPLRGLITPSERIVLPLASRDG